jgi:hypothetical protein
MNQPGNRIKEKVPKPEFFDIFFLTLLKKGNTTEQAGSQDYTPSCDNNLPA